MRAQTEKDFHGFTARGMRDWLEQTWSRRSWHGLQRVRIIHGRGEVLIPELRKWCEEKGIDWSPEPGNPGATLIYPGRRTLPASSHSNRLGTPALRAFRNRVASKQAAQQTKSRSLRDDDVSSGTHRNEDGANDAELFAAEIGRLESEHGRNLLRKKHHG